MPRLIFAAVLGVLLFAVSIIPAMTQTPEATPGATPVATLQGCDELMGYRDRALDSYRQVTDTEWESLRRTLVPFAELPQVRSEHLRFAAE